MADVKDMRQQEAILVVAAHPDDEVLGCGGTLALMSSQGRPVHVLLLADGESSRVSDSGHRIDPAMVAARNVSAEAACQIMGCTSVDLLALPDNRLDGLELLDVVRHIEVFVRRHQPLTVLTHCAGDVNIDHRVVHEAVIAACRSRSCCFSKCLRPPNGVLLARLSLSIPTGSSTFP